MRRVKAFAILEIVVVLVVLSILATGYFFMHSWYTEKARSAEALINVGAIRKAEEVNKLAEGSYLPAESTDRINELLSLNISPKYYEYKVVDVTDEDFVVVAQRIESDLEKLIPLGLFPSDLAVIAMNKAGRIPAPLPSGAGSSGAGGGGIGGAEPPGGGTGGGAAGGGGGGSGTGSGGTDGEGSEGGSGTGEATPVDSYSPVYNTEISVLLGLMQGTTYGGYYYTLIQQKQISVQYVDLGTNANGLYIPSWWLDITVCPEYLPTCQANTIYLNSLLRASWTAEAVSAILVHESMHADYDHNQESHVQETISRLGVERDDLNWYDDPVRGEDVLGDSQDQEFMAFKQEVLYWREIKGNQTNYTQDTRLALYEQDEATGYYLLQYVIAHYPSPGYPPYDVQS